MTYRKKKQIDLNKEPLTIMRLLMKQEFLLYFLLLPILISTILGISGIILAYQDNNLVSIKGTGISTILTLVYGYFIVFIFAFLNTKILYSHKVTYTVHKPITIIISQGISYFIAYFSGLSISSGLLNIIAPSQDEIYLESISYYARIPLLAWFLGGFIIIYAVLVTQIDYSLVKRRYTPQYTPQYTPRNIPVSIKTDDKIKYCIRCGKPLPKRARFCDVCAYPVAIPQTKEVTYKRVSFKQAIDLLDSDSYNRGSTMNIEFECVVQQSASSEKYRGLASYRTIQVTDPAQLVSRNLLVWGDPDHRYSLELVSSAKPNDRLLVIGSKRPEDASYYKDKNLKDMFWIEKWDGTTGGTGTRLLKLESLPTKQVEFSPPISTSETPKEGIDVQPNSLSPQQVIVAPPFYCQLCSIKHKAGTPRKQCENCGRFVCMDAFTDMVKVGRKNCPMCDGELTSV